ncbi:MAG: type II toxin-antitoxin system HicB family antitoxin [Dehalococcoidia bacterium]|nr:type II toxin-antitoxin system HicB family antitoxin [Dehalococcoidia bacterium]MDP6228044.1 type II toxin-antitoxin system HicB family antitoxin [Dehalococcoidia bacterium]MDP7085204.1 type II toxin-antitoxin system HicB family antitoxin [Dehalococcoidia bacterium]MDP7200559.1 type II toxin-antitoxin system HicB family antitoxin [Dehalococcoidia bacterium]MDP7511823.1 type II toxin-antitoxin system HicB family antitoxin [Dehalococcoidia bacterium]
MKYAVVYEKAANNFSAYVPDLPGCVATGATQEEVKRNILDAIEFHLEGMRLEHLPIPEPDTWTETVEVSA